MAQLVTTRISIDGNTVTQVSSFQLNQGIYGHHTFRLVCPAESIDGVSGSVFQSSKNLMGATIAVQVKGSSGLLQFIGIITQVETARFSGYLGDVVITGYSPTIIMDNGPHCKSWEKKAVKNIAQDVVKFFPQNLLQPKVAPLYPETLSYVVQYKETAWQFLSRLCATYGEWFYYDGQKLIIGPPSDSGGAGLIYGSDLSRFNVSLQVRPAGMQMMAYDYMNNKVYTSTPEGVEEKAGLNDLGKHTLQVSKAVYATQPKVWNNHFLTNKKQLDDVVSIRSAMQSSNHVRFNGNSDHPGVAVGSKISVKGQNVFDQSAESYGDYTVIGVNHFFDGQGNYTNDFVAIPASVKLPPAGVYSEPVSETQSAFVTDNYDPKGLGRVRVKFHWMNGSEKTPWIRVTSPHGGGGKGMFFIPEVGEEVIVGFEGDSAVKPYIIGTVYHGQANNAFSNGGNDVKALQTRSGNKLIMNDAEGSVLAEDKDGNRVHMDGAGNITVKSNKMMTMVCGKSKIEMKEDGTITINGKTITSTASEEGKIESGGSSLTLTSKGDVANITAKDTTVKGNTSVTVDGSSTVDVQSNKVTVNGNADVGITGGLVKINS